MEGVIGVVTCFACNFAPRNWAFCNGQLLSIAQNQALFSILGTAYGGDGRTTFALPNLQARTVVSAGNTDGVSRYVLGQIAGTEAVTLTANNVPPHVHDGTVELYIDADSSAGGVNQAADAYPAEYNNAYSLTATAQSSMAALAFKDSVIGPNNGGQPLPVRMPFLGMNYIICLYGIFPSRN